MLKRLGLVGDDEVEYTITSATDTKKKLRKVLFGVEIAVRKSKKNITALVLEGLHFDMLLGMSWIKEANAMVDATKGALSVDSEKL